MIKKLKLSEFTQNYSKILSGNIIGSIIFIITIPIIARIFSPSVYGNYQLYISLVAILNAISSLKFERTIILGKSDYESQLGVKLTFISLLAFSGLLLLISILFNKPLFALLNSENISKFYWLIIIAVILEGTLTIVTQIAIRHGLFGKVGTNRMFQLSGYGTLPILLSYFSDSFAVLVVSRFIVYILSIILLLKPTGILSILKSNTNKKDIIDYSKFHKKFPIFSVPNNFLNFLSIELPVFMIVRHFGDNELGYYAMGLRVLQMPLSLVKNSFSDVYFKTATNAYHTSKEAFINTYKSTAKKLFYLSILSLLLLPILYYFLPKVLGAEWEKTSIIILLLSPYLIANFIYSPLSTSLPIMNKQEYGLILISISIVGRYLLMYAFRYDYYYMILAFSLSSMLFYTIYMLLIYNLIKKSNPVSFS